MLARLAVVTLLLSGVALAIDPLSFLTKYGYLKNNQYSATSLQDAVRSMQRFAHLPETGVLDETTLKKISSRRCGVEDVDSHGYSGVRKWDHKDLTFEVLNTTPDMTKEDTVRVIAAAFKMWSDVTPLTFRQVKSGGDLNIVFGNKKHYGGNSGEHHCRFDFDGEGGVLAHAFYPKDGRAHFDEDEHFTETVDTGVNLFWVAAHEFGHSLGLSHSSVLGALMYPYYGGYQSPFALHYDDITRIQAIYGVPAGFTPLPATTIPPQQCVDQQTEAFCKNNIAFCDSTSSGWKNYMIENCYKSCFCGVRPTTSVATTKESTKMPTVCKNERSDDFCGKEKHHCDDQHESPWKKYMTKYCYKTCYCTGEITPPPPTTTAPPKTSTPVCKDAYGDSYCANISHACLYSDVSWLDFMYKNCYKTCYCK